VAVPTLIQRILEPASGTTSRLVGLFQWQLDDQTRRLTEDTRGATADELAWQPAPGLNTIGMLLAHIAVVEVGWIGVGVLEKSWDEADTVLPMRWKEIGIPFPVDGAPPATLKDRDLAYFDELLAGSRRHTKRAIASLTDADIDRRFRSPLPWDAAVTFEGSVGWVLYHVLEHQAGHYGQINLLRHHYRTRRRPGSPAPPWA
jgi:uncharacterized damage-inducible protein DinB